MEQNKKPTLSLVNGQAARDTNVLAALYKQMTGKAPTPEEMAEAEKHLNPKLDEENKPNTD